MGQSLNVHIYTNKPAFCRLIVVIDKSVFAPIVYVNEKENRGRFVSSCVVQQERNLNAEDDLGTWKGEQQQQHRVCLGGVTPRGVTL